MDLETNQDVEENAAKPHGLAKWLPILDAFRTAVV